MERSNQIDEANQRNHEHAAGGPIAKQSQRACRDTLLWLISVSLGLTRRCYENRAGHCHCDALVFRWAGNWSRHYSGPGPGARKLLLRSSVSSHRLWWCQTPDIAGRLLGIPGCHRRWRNPKWHDSCTPIHWRRFLPGSSWSQAVRFSREFGPLGNEE